MLLTFHIDLVYMKGMFVLARYRAWGYNTDCKRRARSWSRAWQYNTDCERRTSVPFNVLATMIGPRTCFILFNPF